MNTLRRAAELARTNPKAAYDIVEAHVQDKTAAASNFDQIFENTIGQIASAVSGNIKMPVEGMVGELVGAHSGMEIGKFICETAGVQVSLGLFRGKLSLVSSTDFAPLVDNISLPSGTAFSKIAYTVGQLILKNKSSF